MLDCGSWLAGLGCGVLLAWMLRKCSVVPAGIGARGAARMSPTTVMADSSDNFKLVLVVRNDLKMGKGKIAAQCSHATLAAYKKAASRSSDMLRRWEQQGQAKVVVKIEDSQALHELQKHARDAGLLTSVIQDAGRTQIPTGSMTVMGVGPASAELIDTVTGHLKLM